MKDIKNVSPYRWVILLSLLPIIISTEMLWLTIAPIASMAAEFYNVSSMSIDLFAESYMIMFIIFSIPASWVIDKFGYKRSVIIGASLTAVFGITRAIFADNFTIALASQFLIAVGQPFLLNITTKVTANWFPIEERSTAAGILTMAQYLGFAVAMLVSPSLAQKSGISTLLWTFAIVAVISAVISIALTREKPEIPPPGPKYTPEDMSAASFKKLFKNKQYLIVLFICFISMGIFNTILSVTESIFLPRGITSVQAGVVSAVFVVAGIAGAVVLPIISDKLKVRAPLFVVAISLLVPLYAGLTFIKSFIFVSIVAGLAGFVIMGVGPVLFQYGSEAAYPIQEGTSLGVILLMGQISGALFVVLFGKLSESLDSIVPAMLIFVILTAIEIPFTLKMKELKPVEAENEIEPTIEPTEE